MQAIVLRYFNPIGAHYSGIIGEQWKYCSDNLFPNILKVALRRKKFLNVIKHSLTYSENGRLVTFGVLPDSPETGFGYIKSSKPIEKDKIVGENISEFVEKPSLENAKKYLKDNRFFWNSGIFVFKASTILKEIEELDPKLIESCKNSIDLNSKDFNFQRLNKKEGKAGK